MVWRSGRENRKSDHPTFTLFADSSESRTEEEDTYAANRGRKRKAVAQGLNVPPSVLSVT